MPIRIRSALFVDFDNIFIGLKADDLRAAEEFGRGVNKWLEWIGEEMARPSGTQVRDILVRRCYGNPETFSDYRGYFTRNGFSVVDCPPLTTRGKNSADIVMVMDILDLLAHPTQFDEFIIMSADADFTPLVLRLRMHDRRTVAIVAGNAAAAYRASCDLVVSDDEFVTEALRLPQAPAPRPAPRPGPAAPAVSPALLDAIARRVYEAASAGGAVEGSRLPEIFREFKEFTARADWLGFFTLRALTEKLVSLRPELRLTEGQVWSVVVDVPHPAPAAAGPAPVGSGNGNGSAGGSGDLAELRAAMVQAVRQMVGRAEAPMVSATVAQKVIDAVGQAVLDTRWAGAGTFRNFIDGEGDLGLEVLWTPQEGYIYDPERHAPPQPRRGDSRPANLEGLPEELASFIRRIADVSDTPRLSPHQYAVLFEVIAKEVQRTPYELTYTSRVVRDQMLERGETVSRQATAFVLRGVTFSGYRFRRTGVEEARDLAQAFRGNVLNLLRSAQVVLTDGELALLDQWLLEPSGDAGSDREEAAPLAVAVDDDAAGATAGDRNVPKPDSYEPVSYEPDSYQSASYDPGPDQAPPKEIASAEPAGDADASYEDGASPQPDPSTESSGIPAWSSTTGGGEDEWNRQEPAGDAPEPATEAPAGAPSEDVLRAWFDSWASDAQAPSTAEPAYAHDPDPSAADVEHPASEGDWQPDAGSVMGGGGDEDVPTSEAGSTHAPDHRWGPGADASFPAEHDLHAPREPSTDEPFGGRAYEEEHPVVDPGVPTAGPTGIGGSHEAAPEMPGDGWTWQPQPPADPADPADPAGLGDSAASADPAASAEDAIQVHDGGMASATDDAAGETPVHTEEGATVAADAEAPAERAPGWVQWPPFGRTE